MKFPTQRRDLFFALLVAAWAHVGLFFIFVMLLNLGLLAATVIDEKEPEKEDRPIQMQVVYAEPTAETPLPEPEPEPMVPEEEAFVQTNESQEVEEAPKETPFIGERNTTATSDAGAVAGGEKMAALAGEEERKHDPKTFDADFSKGETSGPSEAMNDALESGEGEEQVNEEAATAATEAVEEDAPKLNENELADIDQALAALEEAMGEEKKNPAKKVEESIPEKPAEKEQQAANQDGGFAPRARKTRVAGVISADGKGSLNVADTPVGRYKALIMKRIETAWQMDNYQNRSLNNPGQIGVFFVVDQKGKISRKRLLSRVGTSDNQVGRTFGAIESIKIPKMPADVIKDLEGDVLEVPLTFTY